LTAGAFHIRGPLFHHAGAEVFDHDVATFTISRNSACPGGFHVERDAALVAVEVGVVHGFLVFVGP
jgi:hypothetical protein